MHTLNNSLPLNFFGDRASTSIAETRKSDEVKQPRVAELRHNGEQSTGKEYAFSSCSNRTGQGIPRAVNTDLLIVDGMMQRIDDIEKTIAETEIRANTKMSYNANTQEIEEKEIQL